ncbi:MAG: hypothetical protein COZ37_04315 [bacterium (Candidatus Ratteibacteria) CG_4_10_14_3_um_filter_41_18]|uniref:Trk system potassium uptake protein TrkA n=4 Tax=Candidatus Ratteibacteria TaxID=2979319 RepID=A0A2M7E7H8_9BACT|nr:MAG: hypothetical protein AUJ76_00260 [Candidatus Omnitrophica bacterium CG1_02_41_171]PIV63696.1 MAG: hypothetical protein COS11_06095 [bacterium (Candidatus Ratteibacteria) CG01_land_8_20_14_3_00_40_19]PIW33741.1 MAG: hypothetical protein COW28_02985 [bacterium (Candidatus Ratteibacteria) CG15_BIG_FIL_POST_REV_8_21_14_020_41_12]PIW74255.1 MAG: hypothetical protein CO004_01635 [bacterium (Candidatus Ratteibacteria) CG_4_8_14_3_um_filter_41_36]PIX77133.1 MAG: hypothetical protein COZ37_04315
MYIIIIGCGRVGAQLSQLLQKEGHNIVVVDQKKSAFDRLGKRFNGLTIGGDGSDLAILKEAGIEKADALVVVTDSDKSNIMIAQIGQKIFKVPKAIARIYEPDLAEVYRGFGLNIISGTMLIAARIRDHIIESHLSSYLTESGSLGVLDIPVSSKLEGKKVGEVNVPGEFLVVTLRKNDHPVIPSLDSILEKGSFILGVVRIKSLRQVKKKLGVE